MTQAGKIRGNAILTTIPIFACMIAVTPTIRPIQPEDDAEIAAVIRTVMTAHGADGEGFSIHDAEVDTMYESYATDTTAYFVVERAGRVVGGAGIAPLEGGDAAVCELKKMYFLPTVRGMGMGRAILDHCLAAARVRGFRQCYIETLATMTAAERLYRRAGFVPIERPLGATGHSGCDRYYLLDLV